MPGSKQLFCIPLVYQQHPTTSPGLQTAADSSVSIEISFLDAHLPRSVLEMTVQGEPSVDPACPMVCRTVSMETPGKFVATHLGADGCTARQAMGVVKKDLGMGSLHVEVGLLMKATDTR